MAKWPNLTPLIFVKLCRTTLVSSCGLKEKSHYYSRLSLHEAPTKNTNGGVQCSIFPALLTRCISENFRNHNFLSLKCLYDFCQNCFSDGTVLPTSCTMNEIHHKFGESWRVEEDDWLFSMQFALKIATDIDRGMPYEPSYEPTFSSKEEEREIKDVSATGSHK